MRIWRGLIFVLIILDNSDKGLAFAAGATWLGLPNRNKPVPSNDINQASIGTILASEPSGGTDIVQVRGYYIRAGIATCRSGNSRAISDAIGHGEFSSNIDLIDTLPGGLYEAVFEAKKHMISGQVQVMFDVLTSSLQHIRSGALRALAVMTATRSEALPNLPTVGEFLPGYEASAWYGVAAPKNTPNEIVAKLNMEINAGWPIPTKGPARRLGRDRNFRRHRPAEIGCGETSPPTDPRGTTTGRGPSFSSLPQAGKFH